MAEEVGEVPEEFGLPLAWIGLDDQPIILANQFISQVGQQEEIVISIGHVAPPVLIGTPQEQFEQAKRIPFVAVRPVARISMSRVGLEEFIKNLQQTAANYDRIEETLRELRESS
jgi:hypothetical protein